MYNSAEVCRQRSEASGLQRSEASGLQRSEASGLQRSEASGLLIDLAGLLIQDPSGVAAILLVLGTKQLELLDLKGNSLSRSLVNSVILIVNSCCPQRLFHFEL